MRKGLTLVEILLAVTIVVIVAAIGLNAANPSGQLGKARNNERQLHLEAIMNSIRENIVDANIGAFSCASGLLPTSSPLVMASASGSYDIAPCLVPIYLPVMPFDPVTSTAHWGGMSDYNTGYTIVQNASTGVITIAAPAAELNKSISISR